MKRKAYTRPVTHYFDLVAEHLMDDSQIVHVSVPIDPRHELDPDDIGAKDNPFWADDEWPGYSPWDD